MLAPASRRGHNHYALGVHTEVLNRVGGRLALRPPRTKESFHGQETGKMGGLAKTTCAVRTTARDDRRIF